MTAVVRATAADAAVTEAVVAAAFAGYVPRIGRPPAPMTADYPALIAAGHVWLGADPDPVGVLVLVPMPDHLLLDTVAVHPAAQGRGVGAALLRFAEERARALGLPEIRLYTNAAMHENLAYYPRRGYRETRRATEAGFHRVYYTKEL
ncbi:GNAT family N-acetyltransferase [Dactylosporangium sp. NPDC000244]|uniref:GNAT family N-acetyltransferase n=1 Tax=Dactylosporangium sp. NPDC000244 TaxID=3154365 RepID=UPI00332276E0